MRRRCAFTLIEVLVVVVVIALLLAILLPSLNRTRAQGRAAVCRSNLHQLGVAVNVYAEAHASFIPRGGSALHHFSEGQVNWVVALLPQVGVRLSAAINQAEEAGAVQASFRDGEAHDARGIVLNDAVWGLLGGVPVFHCPERVYRSDELEVVSYVVNAYGPGHCGWVGAGDEVSRPTRISSWKRPTQVVYLADLEHASASRDVDRTYRILRDLGRLCAFRAEHLPNADPSERRIARGMHLGHQAHGLFLDAHVEALGTPTSESETGSVLGYEYARRWLQLLGTQG